MKIGKLDLPGNIFLAPMAGITDPAFRRTVQRFGISALWTEMMSAGGIVAEKTVFATMRLEGHVVPTVFQIFGKDPEVMAEAAKRLEDLGAAAIDLNMGCPVRKVVQRGAGAALMKDLPLAGRVVARVRGAVSIPVTVKMRSGWDENDRNAPQLARLAEQEGADAVVVHSRTRSRRHAGPASLDVLAQVKQSVRVPVIGNGAVRTAQDALAMIEGSGCDGVMVGRGALGRPWLPGRFLRELGYSSDHPDPGTTYVEVIRDHYRLQLEAWDPFTAVLRMRKHLAWYSRGFPFGAAFRTTVLRERDPVRVLDGVERFFGKALIHET